MPSPLSADLRQRVVSAVSEGASCHQTSARFGISVSSASRWSEQFRQKGQLAPKPSGGDHTSYRIEAHAELILTTYEARPAIFLHELRDALAEHGVQTSTSSLRVDNGSTLMLWATSRRLHGKWQISPHPVQDILQQHRAAQRHVGDPPLELALLIPQLLRPGNFRHACSNELLHSDAPSCGRTIALLDPSNG